MQCVAAAYEHHGPPVAERIRVLRLDAESRVVAPLVWRGGIGVRTAAAQRARDQRMQFVRREHPEPEQVGVDGPGPRGVRYDGFLRAQSPGVARRHDLDAAAAAIGEP